MIRKLTILIILSAFLVCCVEERKHINIEFKKSDESVTIFYSKKSKTIWAIAVPFDMTVENPYNRKLSFFDYSYIYGNGIRGKAMKLYLKNESELLKQSVSKVKYMDAKQTYSYLVKSKHFVDSTKFGSTYFRSYIEEMQRLNKDTLHIGTISEVKAKHKYLLESSVQDDSVHLTFINENSDRRYRRERRRVEY